MSYNKIGDVQVAQGNLPAALTSYQAGLAIRDRLAKSDPGNADWQRDLSLSYEKVGDVQVAQGNLPAALASYQASLAIFDRLAKSDPGNGGWQRDLSVSYGKIGNVQVAQGNLPAALTSFQAGLAIADRLAKSDPGNAGWQRDLRCRTATSARCRWSRAICRPRLTPFRRASPLRTAWQSPIPAMPTGRATVGVIRQVGDVQKAQGNLPAALNSYQASLRHQGPLGEVRSRQCRLAARSGGFVRQDRRRAGGAGQSAGRADVLSGEPRYHGPLGEVRSRQCRLAARLAVSYDKIGEVQVAQGNLPAALTSYQASLAIVTAWQSPIPAMPAGSTIWRSV